MHATWPSENILLGLLCERPRHGYELAQAVRTDEAMYVIWRLERSEVYFLLGKLARRGHIEQLTVDKAGGPARTVYASTEAGRVAFIAWLRSPEHHPRNLRTSFLARAYLAMQLDPRLAVEVIEAQTRALVDWLAGEEDRIAGNEVVALVRKLRAAQVEATLVALEDFRRLALARLQGE